MQKRSQQTWYIKIMAHAQQCYRPTYFSCRTEYLLFIFHPYTRSRKRVMETTALPRQGLNVFLCPVEPSMVDLLQLHVSYNGNSKWFPISYTSNKTNRIDCGATRHLPIQVQKTSWVKCCYSIALYGSTVGLLWSILIRFQRNLKHLQHCRFCMRSVCFQCYCFHAFMFILYYVVLQWFLCRPDRGWRKHTHFLDKVSCLLNSGCPD